MSAEFKVNDIEVPRRLIAEDALISVLNGKFPDIRALSKLWRGKKTGVCADKIEAFLELDILPYLNQGNKVRYLTDPRESEIYIKQQEAQSTDFFIYANQTLNEKNALDLNVMQDVYGEYAQAVSKTFNMFQYLRKERTCGLPSANHLLRTSVMASALGFDLKSNKPKNYYAAVWALHDTVEDLLFSIRDEKGKVVYGLEELTNFLNDFIPTDMQEDIMMVTNKSDLILDHLASKNYKLSTKGEMIEALSSMRKQNKFRFIEYEIYDMIKIIEKLKIESGRDSFRKDAEWGLYSNKFINDLGEQAYAKDHFALFEGKGTVDILDNCISIKAEDLKRKKRALLKARMWGAKADEIIAREKAQNREYQFFESKVWQTMNYANFEARNLVIYFLAGFMSEAGHLNVALNAISELKSILYTK